MTDQSNAQLQLSQLLFSGQYWASLQTARMAEELTRQSADLSTLDVKESVSGTYYLILVNEALDQVLEENIGLLEEVRQHTENMYQAGLAEQTDVDQISVSLAQLRNQKQAMERGILLSYNMLRFQLGLESDREVLLSSPLSALLPAEEATRILASNFPLEQHPNYRMIQTRERLQEKQVDMEKWAYAPSLTGFYSYTEKLLTTGFDLSPNHAAGLNLSIPIYSSGMRKARLEKSKIALDQARRDREIVSEQLKLQDNQLRNELMAALDNYQLQQENVKVAARLRNSMTNKYRQGVISSLELTQANTQYLQAESNYLSAAMELLQARLKINKLYNQL
jgi:outer membrane protein TolC